MLQCQPTVRQWPGERCARCLQKNIPCSEGQLASKSRPLASILSKPSTKQQSQQPTIAPKNMALLVQAQPNPTSPSTRSQPRNTDRKPIDIHEKWTNYETTDRPAISSLRLHLNDEHGRKCEERNSREASVAHNRSF